MRRWKSDEVAAQGQIGLCGGGRLVFEAVVAGHRLQPAQPGEVLRPQAVGELRRQLTGHACLSEVIERGGGELEAGLALGVGDGGVLAQAQPSYEGGQGHALRRPASR